MVQDVAQRRLVTRMMLYIIEWRFHCIYFDHYYHALHVCGVASHCQHWSTLVHKSRLYVRCRLVFRKRSCIENRPEEGWAEKLGCRTRGQMRKSPASWAAHLGSMDLMALFWQSYDLRQHAGAHESANWCTLPEDLWEIRGSMAK